MRKVMDHSSVILTITLTLILTVFQASVVAAPTLAVRKAGHLNI